MTVPIHSLFALNFDQHFQGLVQSIQYSVTNCASKHVCSYVNLKMVFSKSNLYVKTKIKSKIDSSQLFTLILWEEKKDQK